MRPRGIILHTSDSPFGTPALIDRWHKDRNFMRMPKFVNQEYPLKHIGYHYVITNGYKENSFEYDPAYDGAIHNGRQEVEIGAHAIGNNEDIGICLIGRNGKYSSAQLISAYMLIATLILRYNLKVASVKGHYETPAEMAKPESERKTCPDLAMNVVRTKLNGVMGLLQTYFLRC